MKLTLLPQPFAVCKLIDMSQINWNDEFVFFSKTDDELSLVCVADNIPANATHIENGWRALKIEGVLDFSLVGILAKLSALLAENEISIFAVSTFNTDYIFLKADMLDTAVNVITEAGYEVWRIR